MLVAETETTTGRFLRRVTDEHYLVIVDGETIGEVYRDPSFTDSHPWAARLTNADRRLGNSHTTIEVAARNVYYSAGVKLRSKAVADLTDGELLWRIESEQSVLNAISQSDAIGTAARIGKHQDDNLFPLYRERKRRGLEGR